MSKAREIVFLSQFTTHQGNNTIIKKPTSYVITEPSGIVYASLR